MNTDDFEPSYLTQQAELAATRKAIRIALLTTGAALCLFGIGAWAFAELVMR